MCNVIAEYKFYFFLPSRKFKICWVIFKEGKKTGILPASQWSRPKVHTALAKALTSLGRTQVMRSFTREISPWRGGGWVSTHSSGRKGRGLVATLLRTAILAFSGVDIWCLLPLEICGYLSLLQPWSPALDWESIWQVCPCLVTSGALLDSMSWITNMSLMLLSRWGVWESKSLQL